MPDESAVIETEVVPPPLIDETPPEPAPVVDAQNTEKPAPADEEVETTEQQEVKKQSRFQRRLDAQKTARVAAETELRILREQHTKLEAQLRPQSQDSPATQAPQREQFQDYESYLDARATFQAEQAAAKLFQKQHAEFVQNEGQRKQATEQEKISQDWSKREDEFQAKQADYLEVVTPYVETDLGKLSDGARRLILEAGPEVLYHLADNPDVADRIAELSPLRQVVEIGKLEGITKAPIAKKVTNAPPVLQPVRQGKSTVNGYHDNMTDSEYESWRKSQGARWAR